MSNQEFKVVVEQRIGLVMYGGISLAIYMNGVAQEFLNLVLSTAHDSSGEGLLTDQVNPDGTSKDARKPLTGIQHVYRELARELTKTKDGPIPTKFVVDILTGTSAGGLNAMYLGKSISEKVSLKPLQTLWVEEGDISILLNDKASYQGLFGLPKKPARSLLNSRRMYAKLVAAFAQMEGRPLFNANANGFDLCTELDVYMTATDLIGKASPVYLGARDFAPHVAILPGSGSKAPVGANQVQKYQLEAEHRAVFHFRYEAADYQPGSKRRNDFEHDYLPFLAFVGRCTSSIVPAFEPMRLIDTKDVLEKTGLPFSYTPQKWTNLFRQYWRETPLYFPEKNAGDVIADAKKSFEWRTFGDGGYLDNKPFGYAFKELTNRRADVAVRRNVFYVEPHPEDNQKTLVETTQVPDNVQNVVEHAKLALTLPSVQNINERVMAIRDQGEYADRVLRAVNAAKQNSKEDTINREVASSINLESTLDMLADVLVDMLGFDPDNAVKPALRHLLHASLEIVEDGANLKNAVEKRKDILEKFDLKHARRKVEWLRLRLERKIVEVAYAENPSVSETQIAETQQTKTENLGAKFFHRTNPTLVFDRVIRVLDFIRQGEVTFDGIALAKSATCTQPGMDKLLEDLRKSESESDLIKGLLELRINLDELVYVMAAKRSSGETESGGVDELRRERARQVLGSKPFPDSISAKMMPEDFLVRKSRPNVVKKIFNAVANILDLKTLNEDIQKWPEGGAKVIQEFEREDNFVFPLMYPAGLGDSYALDITRISPKDAVSLEDDEAKRVEKLSGVSLGHFGAFFTRAGRIMDIIWGRLNTTEIILNTYLDLDAAQKLLPKAQLAIIGESLEEFAEEIANDELASKVQGHITMRMRLENLVGVILAKAGPVDLSVLATEGVLTSQQAKLIEKYGKNFEGGDAMAGEKPDAETMWEISPRASQVLAQIFDESIASKPWFKWPQLLFLYAGRILMLLVEATVPQKPFYRALTYWYQILFTITTIACSLSLLGIWKAAGPTAWRLMLVLVSLWCVTAFIRKAIYKRIKLWLDGSTVVTLVVAVAFALIGTLGIKIQKSVDFMPTDQVSQGAIILAIILVVGVIFAHLVSLFAEPFKQAIASKKKGTNSPSLFLRIVDWLGHALVGVLAIAYILCVVVLGGWVVVQKLSKDTSGEGNNSPAVSQKAGPNARDLSDASRQGGSSENQTVLERLDTFVRDKIDFVWPVKK